ncbi:hypothetical protein BLNAU_17812 [Blattamonas nauphoetae]|uniref:Uncharacterized protein n=1 Tax=Blattamonas nauphoetae TaxID=2049346 RepID=A0ABQ9X657_9EUKA|nr:hypothetical protein BLNAU_17812 [Blattamonas nauphoetae]
MALEGPNPSVVSNQFNRMETKSQVHFGGGSLSNMHRVVIEGWDDAHSLKLDIVGVIYSDSEESRHPLINTPNHPVTLQNCHFNTTDEVRRPANFEVPLVSFSSTVHVVSIKSSSITFFSVSGHALLAITTEQLISFVSVKSEGLTQTVLGKVRCGHVTSSSLGTVVIPSGWSSFFPAQHLLDIVGCDSSLSSGHPFSESSLLFHLLPPT